METLIIAAKDPQHAERLQSMLHNEFSVLIANRDETVRSLLDQRRVYALLQEISFAKENDYALLQMLCVDARYEAIPVIAFSFDAGDVRYADCLSKGASDFLLPPFEAALINKRIHNAVRSKESFTFSEIENILHELPSNIYLKDAKGRYLFATHYWHHIKKQRGDWSIRGKTDLEIRTNKANALKAAESDKVILATGKGTSYIIEEQHNGISEYLELIKRPTHDKEGRVNGIVALINNVTENQLLKLELERRSNLDSLTGLLNKTATQEVVDLEISKSARAGKHSMSALMMIDVDNFKSVNDTFGHATGDNVLMIISSIINKTFKGLDVKGRVGGDEYIVFARAINSSTSAKRLANTLEMQVIQAFAGGKLEGMVSLSIGIALYPEHGTSFKELYKNADEAMYKVKKCGKGSCCLFS